MLAIFNIVTKLEKKSLILIHNINSNENIFHTFPAKTDKGLNLGKNVLIEEPSFRIWLLHCQSRKEL